jgi:hypothetical protein
MELLLSCCWHIVEIGRLTCLLGLLPESLDKETMLWRTGMQKDGQLVPEMGFFGNSYEGQGDVDGKNKAVWAPSLLVIMAVEYFQCNSRSNLIL